MPAIAIPNVSEGRDEHVLAALRGAVSEAACRVVDVHTDGVHNRTVFTVAAREAADLPAAMAALAVAAADEIDLSRHTGVHPRVGCLDVCPFVPMDEHDHLEEAVVLAHRAGALIAAAGLPVFFYAAASDKRRELPDLRRGGLDGLVARVRDGDPPDLGPAVIDPARGVVLVGARGPLIAYNIWIGGRVSIAKQIARQVRRAPGVRALGVEIAPGVAQVSMNLTEPATCGIDDVTAIVVKAAESHGVKALRGEVVGVPPGRFLPAPDAPAARLIDPPGRSLEAALR